MRNTPQMTSSPNQEAPSRRTKLGLGLRNGMLMGLALALGTWGLQVITLAPVPVRLLYPPLILGGLALLFLGGLAGWLTAWFGSTLAGLLIWAVSAVLMALVISHMPYDGYNLTVWLADRRSWGLPVLPFAASAQVRFWLAGFFVALILAILGLLQDYRLEGLEGEVNDKGRLSGRGWLLLLLPLPLVLGAGLIADNIINSPLRAGPRLVNEAIRTSRTYDGDLFELSLESGVNYNAFRAVRDLMTPNYTLQVAEADLGAAESIVVVTEFDNGAWIYCGVVAGNLSNCYDASPPYTRGLAALLVNGAFPEDCPACRFRVDDELRAWLAERGGRFRDDPRVTRLGQWGSYVLMRVEAQANDYAIECRFHGITPVELEECWEVEDAAEDLGGAVGLPPTLPAGAGESPEQSGTGDLLPAPLGEEGSVGDLRPAETVPPAEGGAVGLPPTLPAGAGESQEQSGTGDLLPAPLAEEGSVGDLRPAETALPAEEGLVKDRRPTEARAPAPGGALALYASAMRPDFVADLISVGPVSQYRIEVTIRPEEASVSGAETVRYVNTAPVPLNEVYFRLFPNLPGYGGEMAAGDICVGPRSAPRDGDAPDFAQPVAGLLEVRGTALRVPLAAPLQPGEETTITLEFSTSVPSTAGEGYGQFIYQQDVMALANFFPLIPAYDEENCARHGNCAGGWNIEYAVPFGDAVFSPSALFDVSVTVPAEWTVVASGTTVAKEDGSDDTVTWHIVSGPMRDFDLVLSPRFEVATQKVDDILVNSYYLPEDTLGGKRVLRWTTDALAFFSELFGPYPFAEFDAVATPTVAGGIEYPGLIAMPINSYGDTSGRFQWSTVHEVAHQWWYSLVGNDQQDEPWLDEALTQYSTVLFYELHEGWDGAVREVLEPRYQQVAGTEEDDLISRPVAAYTESNYGPVVYAKGPLFFHALRQEVGDDVFYTIARSYFDNYRYKVANGQDFLGLAEQVSGQDLTKLFQKWLGDVADVGP
jgi:hypothetical protein